MSILSTESRSVKIFRLPEVATLTGLARSTIYAKLSQRSRYFDPSFPSPVRLGQRTVGWRADEISAWISSCPRTQEPTGERV